MERLRGANEDRAISEGGPNGCEASRSFDPEGAKTPEGERRLAAQPAKQAGQESNGFEAWMQPEAGANQRLAAEPKSRTGRKNRLASERSSRPGPLTLEWNSRKRRPFQVRKRPLRANGPVLERHKGCGASGSDEAEAG